MTSCPAGVSQCVDMWICSNRSQTHPETGNCRCFGLPPRLGALDLNDGIPPGKSQQTQVFFCSSFTNIVELGMDKYSSRQITTDTGFLLFPLLITQFNSAWISNDIFSKVWDTFTYPFPNFNGDTVEVWE